MTLHTEYFYLLMFYYINIVIFCSKTYIFFYSNLQYPLITYLRTHPQPPCSCDKHAGENQKPQTSLVSLSLDIKNGVIKI